MPKIIRKRRAVESFQNLKKRAIGNFKRFTQFIQRKPFTSFLLVLAILLLAILSNAFFIPKAKEEAKKPQAKEIEVYRIGEAARMNILAKVEKRGVIRVVALTSGVVSEIAISEGVTVSKGANLISLSSNYQGGNPGAIQRAIAFKQYQLTNDTFDIQKEAIVKRRELAEKTDANTDDIRSIINDSLSDTRSLVSLNDDILNTIDANLKELEQTNTNGANDAAILASKQLKSQFFSANNQIKQGLKRSEFESSSDKPPAQLSNVQKDLAILQLSIEEKSLEVGREIGRLQVALADLSASLFHPVAPIAGKVERVHVKPFETVVPGMPLVTLSSDGQDIFAIALVPFKIAKAISKLEDSTLYIGEVSYKTKPTYVSQEATNGQLYSVIFSLPSNFSENLTDGEYIRIEVPIGYANTGKTLSFIPIDSVYQTQENAYVYIVEDGKAKEKSIVLGEVVGSDVEVRSGLSTSDQVIKNRSVIAGESVSIVN